MQYFHQRVVAREVHGLLAFLEFVDGGLQADQGFAGAGHAGDEAYGLAPERATFGDDMRQSLHGGFDVSIMSSDVFDGVLAI